MLRVFECGRQLAGTVDGVTLVKLFRRRARVSYLVYEDFDRVAHPALRSAVVADLKQLDIRYRDYTRSSNPPVLHQKELFIAADYPARPRFARLTARQDRLGLLDATATIGTKSGWLSVLARHGPSVLSWLDVLLRLCLLSHRHARIPRIGCPSTSASRKSRPPKR